MILLASNTPSVLIPSRRDFLISNGQLLNQNPLDMAKISVSSTNYKEISKVMLGHSAVG